MRSVLKSFGSAALLAFVGLAFLSRVSAGETPLSAAEIMNKAVAQCEKPGRGLGTSNYTYTKLTVVEELDSAGHIKERKEKVYEVSLKEGRSYLSLVAVNGKPPAEADRKKQAQNEVNVRQILGHSKAASLDRRESLLSSELIDHYSFELIRQVPINGRSAYEIKFSPRTPEPPVRHVIDRLLNRLSGTIWIDTEEFELARADVNLASEVNLLGGLVGSLKRLAFTINRTRLSEGLWLSTSSTGDFEGRKLLDSTRIKTRTLSRNFHPLG